ncbi:MAG: hypothetical protein ACR2QE_12960 [Acidimicrobiales bacterium]
MRDTIRSLGMLVIGGAIALFVAATGIVQFGWPWDVDEVASIDTTVVVEEPAQVFEIEAVRLDCRARVHAEVPLEGRREHRLFGQVYRTDTIEMTAIGDVDTCVDPDLVQIAEGPDGKFSVTVPAEAIEFVRPRVDMERTSGSVSVNKGLVGKVTDVFPWVGENNGLTTEAYTYAQRVIGGSECMEAAYRTTSRMLTDAYRAQMRAQGGDPAAIEVTIDGSPQFGGRAETTSEDIDLEVTAAGTTCTVAADAVGAPRVSSS